MNYITKGFVILDNDATYAAALARYIKLNRTDIIAIQVFTDVDMFLEYIRKNRISMAIIGQSASSLVKEDLIKVDITTIELVEEIDNANGLDLIYKYQSAKNILHSIENILIASGQKEKSKDEADSQTISILSPTGSISTAVMALAIANYISKKERTLYLNLNPFSGLEKIIWTEHHKGLSDILYYYRQGEASILNMQQTYRMVGNIVYIPQADHYADMFSMEAKDINQLIKEAKEELSCTKVVICMKQITSVEEEILIKSNSIYIEQSNVEHYNTENTMLLDMLMAKGVIRKEEVKELPYIDTNQFNPKDFLEIIFKENQLNMYIEPLISG